MTPKDRDRHPLYKSLVNAKQRCNNKNCKKYKNYGGRGIKYKLGRHKEAFYALIEMWEKAKNDNMQESITIDRIDNDGDYEYGNIQFVTVAENARRGNIGRTLTNETKLKMIRSRYKPVQCIETGCVYKSLIEAERLTGANKVCISKVCLGKRKTAGKLHWRFVRTY